MDFEKIKEIVEATWFIPVITLVGAVIGGIFTLLGSILGTYLQSNINSKENKRLILLDYYKSLADLKDYIESFKTVINMTAIENKIKDYKKEFNSNGKFSYYIGKKILKKKHSEFINDLDKLVADKSKNMNSIKEEIIELINTEMDLAMKKM